ncbi:ABC transporter substrate-binding protein [Paenibacillus sp. alder61]|uniref:ABC transporter substrate-binding protein n=1 Tax=Paenibacillus faecis TaxID=862114 RepID=A0A5D0CRN5_9BACL|nr:MULTISPECIES: ABC transporter substrate-binding protein [Paenibacillus]MCA1295991.1 ABC transporter substrate-binding protein [Paenibacillus sp. alder61]TYA12398.1 ABC transporter substrate-binding protein [Paenibacillus faecis]
MRKKSWGLLVLLLVFSLVLGACSGGGGGNTATTTPGNEEGNKTESKGENATPPAEAAPEGVIEAVDMSLNPPAAVNRKDTLIVGMTDPKGVFNPLFRETTYDAYVCYVLFDSFIEVAADGTYTNSLAEKVDVSEDGLKYTYHLKPGVTFTDGKPMTVKDYYFTLKTLLDASYDGQSDPMSYNIVGAKEYHEGKAKEISGVKIIDDHTVEVSITEFSALTPVELGNIFILPEHYYGPSYKQGNLDGVKALNSKPLGSGQYKLTKYSPGQEVVFEANENYFRGAPKVKNVIFKTTTETTNLPMLQQGETDMDEGISVSEDNVEALKEMGFVDINLLPNNGYGYIAFNHKLKKFQDVKVRQALVYGLNRKEIVAGIYGPYADVINIPESTVSWAHTKENIETYDFDLEKAKQMLDEAGWKVGSSGIREKDGEKFKINFSATADNPVVDALLPIMTQNYKELGIEVVAETLDFNAIMDKANTGDFDMFFAAWGLTPDPDNTVYITNGAQNDIGYSNAKVDELMAKGKKTLDIEERKKIYKEMYQEMNKDVPVILLYQRKNMLAVNGRVEGFDFSPYKYFAYSLYQVEMQ